MIALGFFSILILSYVMYLQVKNYRSYTDGNGQDKNRLLFMVQVFCFKVLTVATMLNAYGIVYSVLLVISVNALTFYKGWDIRKIWRKKKPD